MEDIKVNSAKNTKYLLLLKPCIVKTPVVVSVKSDIQVYIGQGEGETKWNG